MKIKQMNKNQIIPNDLPIIASLTVATLCMLPGVAYDPTNLPRLVLISLIAAWTLPQLIAILIVRIKSKTISLDEKILLFLIFCFFCWAIIGSFFNETAALQELLGDFGRSTGIIAYFSLFTLLLWSSISGQYEKNISLQTTFRVLFLITNIYFALQYFGLDPIEWDNVYGVRIIGTVGNPNFSSMISAFSTLFFSSQVLFRKLEINVKQITDLIGLFASSVFVIVNPSSQGIVATFLGLSLQIISKVPIRVRKIALRSAAGLMILVIGLAITLIVSEKYLSIPLLASNLAFRILAWDASWKIMIAHPLFGTGFDSMGSWFTQYRNIRRAQDYLDYTYADATHNVYLDQGVNGGIPIFMLYFLIFLVISWTTVSHLSKTVKVSGAYSFLASAWFAFVFYQLISINQLGIATLGLIIGGLLVGNKGGTYEGSNEGSRKLKIVSYFVAIALALAPMQALRKDIAFLEAITSGDGSRLIIAASMWPQNDFYYARTADILYNNGYTDLARQEAEKALNVNARNIIALKLLLKDSSLSSEEESFYLRRLKALDPLAFQRMKTED